MERSYLIRYGLMGLVGRFSADHGTAFDRGQTVVVRSHRGTELGEVLVEAPDRSAAEVPHSATAHVLRPAGQDDIERAGLVSRTRDERFDACRRVFEGGVWPIDLIDVEPLLDDRRTVLHYLGPHRLDVTGVLAAFRDATDLDVMLQPVGRDVPDDERDPDPADDHDGGSCGSEGGGCGTGGCGTSSGGCGTSSGGCSDCGVQKLLASRR